MPALRFHPGVIAIALSLVIVATVALSVTALADTGAIGGQLRLLIGAVTGLALVVLANFAILEDEPEATHTSRDPIATKRHGQDLSAAESLPATPSGSSVE